MAGERSVGRRRQADLLEATEAEPVVDAHASEAQLAPEADTSDASSHDLREFEFRKPIRAKSARIRLPVSGMVELTPLEAAVVDTRLFQRLRKIRQLGGTYIVYPGANHSRFEHCLGVVATAAQMCDAVNHNMRGVDGFDSPAIQDEDRKLIRLAALLHDIGHLAFGHTLEDEVGLFEKHDSNSRLDALLLSGEIAQVFDNHRERDTLEQVVAILRKDAPDQLPAGKVFCADIVTNTVCADLLDYLKRDIYHLGLDYSYDPRLYEYMVLAPDRMRRTRFAIRLMKGGKLRHDAITQIFELLNLRYILAEAALFHHAKDAHSAMLSRALLESHFLLGLVCSAYDADDDATRLRECHASQDGSHVEEYFRGDQRPDPDALQWLGDDELIARLVVDSHPVTSSLAEMIEARQLYRTQASIDFDAARVADAKNAIINDLHKEPWKRFGVERLIEEELGLPRGSILLYCPSAGMNSKVAKVHIVMTETAVPLDVYEEETNQALTAGYLDAQLKRYQGLWRTYLFVHPNMPSKSAERAEKYLRARYYLFGQSTATASRGQREAKRETEYRDIAADIFGERHPSMSYARIQELRSDELVTIESRVQQKTHRVRQYLEAFELAGAE